MKTIPLLVLLLTTACLASPQREQPTSNPHVDVVLLFQTDGCNVYRFNDGGRAHYFAHCSGAPGTSVENSVRVQQGKTTVVVPDGTTWSPDR